MASYKYSTLKNEKQEIRLLTLWPGPSSSEVRLVLKNVRLTTETKRQYEALSYAWGSTTDLVPIKIGERIIHCARNLANLLPYLRYEDRPRVLWIDAICVNQQDLEERSRQVQRMVDIYTMAKRVLVWIGAETDESTLAMKTLQSLASKIVVHWNTYQMKPATHESDENLHWADRNCTLPYDGRTLQAIAHLLSRSWFERLWIWQEIRLANPDALLICGSDTMPWAQFSDAIFCFVSKNKSMRHLPGGFRFRLRQCSNNANQLVANRRKALSLSTLIPLTRFAQCSDPRDRVYALLSMRQESELQISIKPDYTKSPSEVYMELVQEYVECQRHLSLLQYCELKSEGSADMPVPSWVPDLAAQLDVEPVFRYCYSASNSQCEYEFPERGVLKLTGFRKAQVSLVEETGLSYDHGSFDYKDAIQRIRKFSPAPNVMSSEYVGGGTMFDAYCRTICCDHFSERHIPPNISRPSLQASREVLRSFLQRGDLDWNSNLDRRWRSTPEAINFLRYVSRAFSGRSYFTTGEGYIGLAPKATRTGDCVYVLLGSKVPMILRPVSEKKYKVVGPCFVYGLMYKESLSGPLADNVLYVLNQGLDGYWSPKYTNCETGEIFEDPRGKGPNDEDLHFDANFPKVYQGATLECVELI